MILFLGGHLGSGKKGLAQKLSERYNFYPYHLSEELPHRFIFDKKGVAHEVAVPTYSDEGLLAMYKKVAEKFSTMSKLYDDVVVQHTFHRDVPREYLLAEARRYFDDVVFVWVDVDDESLQKRFALMRKKKVVCCVKHARMARAKTLEDFQAFRPAPLTFLHSFSRPKVAEELRALASDRKSA